MSFDNKELRDVLDRVFTMLDAEGICDVTKAEIAFVAGSVLSSTAGVSIEVPMQTLLTIYREYQEVEE